MKNDITLKSSIKDTVANIGSWIFPIPVVSAAVRVVTKLAVDHAFSKKARSVIIIDDFIDSGNSKNDNYKRDEEYISYRYNRLSPYNNHINITNFSPKLGENNNKHVVYVKQIDDGNNVGNTVFVSGNQASNVNYIDGGLKVKKKQINNMDLQDQVDSIICQVVNLVQRGVSPEDICLYANNDEISGAVLKLAAYSLHNNYNIKISSQCSNNDFTNMADYLTRDIENNILRKIAYFICNILFTIARTNFDAIDAYAKLGDEYKKDNLFTKMPYDEFAREINKNNEDDKKEKIANGSQALDIVGDNKEQEKPKKMNELELKGLEALKALVSIKFKPHYNSNYVQEVEGVVTKFDKGNLHVGQYIIDIGNIIECCRIKEALKIKDHNLVKGLPNEVWDKIFRLVAGKEYEDINSLFSISQVCKDFYNISQNVLVQGEAKFLKMVGENSKEGRTYYCVLPKGSDKSRISHLKSQELFKYLWEAKDCAAEKSSADLTSKYQVYMVELTKALTEGQEIVENGQIKTIKPVNRVFAGGKQLGYFRL